MIVVTGTILAKPDTLAELLVLSIEHAQRSRTEPGCAAHAVHRDAEDPLRLVFVEEWADRKALLDHFAAPASRAFAKKINELASAPASLQIYEAALLQPAQLAT